MPCQTCFRQLFGWALFLPQSNQLSIFFGLVSDVRIWNQADLAANVPGYVGRFIHCSAEYTLRNIAQPRCGIVLLAMVPVTQGFLLASVCHWNCHWNCHNLQKNEFIYEAHLSWKWGGFNFGFCLPPLAATSLNQNVSDTTWNTLKTRLLHPKKLCFLQHSTNFVRELCQQPP